MQTVKAFAKKYLPQALIKWLIRVAASRKRQLSKYSSISLTAAEIDSGEYKKYLGGGFADWESRGFFQLFFLQNVGMMHSSKVLDIGCGPGRASKHIIDFLDSNHYYGLDDNASFIEAARKMVDKNGLAMKNPVLEVVENFRLENIHKNFDYAILFSVLNHCNNQQKTALFLNIHKPLVVGGKVYITHAHWFNEKHLKNTKMKLTKQFEPDEFDITRFGWKNRDDIFPIIELTKT